MFNNNGDCNKQSRQVNTSELSSLKTEWMTTEQAAAYLCISVGVLRNMTSNGQVPYYKLQSRNRYLAAELRELLLKNKRGDYRGD